MKRCTECGKKTDSSLDWCESCLRDAVATGAADVEGDLSFVLYERISARIHEMIDDITRDVPVSVDESIRTRLGDEFRFWRKIDETR